MNPRVTYRGFIDVQYPRLNVVKSLSMFYRGWRESGLNVNYEFIRGIYSGQPEKFPPPLKFVEILPCFWRFFFGHLGFIKVF